MISKFIHDLFEKSENRKFDLKTFHDYTKQFWGHSIDLSRFRGTNSNGIPFQNKFPVTGFGHGIKSNHHICIEMDSGNIGIIKLEKVSYYRDPSDMWNATGKWIGYFFTDERLISHNEFKQLNIGL